MTYSSSLPALNRAFPLFLALRARSARLDMIAEAQRRLDQTGVVPRSAVADADKQGKTGADAPLSSTNWN